MKQRQTELDILRFLALLCVVGLHLNSGVWNSLPIMSGKWLVVTLQRITWAVPVFVMISGRFFLDPKKKITTKDIFGKYVFRIAVAFLFWGVIYQIHYLCVSLEQGETIATQWKNFVVGIFTGAYHMWYLWMLIGLYAITPILRKIAEDEKLTVYFLAIFFVVQTLNYFVRELPKVGTMTGEIMDDLQLHFVLGYTGYYLLGYQVHRWKPSKKQEMALYILGLLIAVFAPAANILYTSNTGNITEYFTQYLSPTMILESVAVYTFFVKRVAKINWKERTRKFFAAATKYGFGAYLSHAIVLSRGMPEGSMEWIMDVPLVMMPVFTLYATAISYILAALLHNIPKVGKYIA